MYYASCILYHIWLCLHKSIYIYCIYIYIYTYIQYIRTHVHICPHMLGQTSRWQYGPIECISAISGCWVHKKYQQVELYELLYMSACCHAGPIRTCAFLYVSTACVLECSPLRTARLNIPYSKSGIQQQQVCFKIGGPRTPWVSYWNKPCNSRDFVGGIPLLNHHLRWASAGWSLQIAQNNDVS